MVKPHTVSDEMHRLFSPSGELVALTTRFTDELMNQGLTKRILALVSEISVAKEFERLQKERGLGNEKHRKEVGTSHWNLKWIFLLIAPVATEK